MDGSSSPRWARGCKPVAINPLPASFVTFFPAASEAKTKSLETSWADKFVAQRPATISRAWCRVPVAAGPLTIHRGRTIMKRVGRPASAPAVRPQQAAAVEAAAEDPEEIQRASRRRLNSFVPPAYDAELELAGSPPSRAEVVNIMIRAKVNVANCFLREEHSNLSAQKLVAKQSTFSKLIVPLKRRFHDYSSIDLEYASGGNRIAIFSELDPIISKALQTGATEIDVSMASITEASANLQSTRRNPRTSLAASGTPDLPDIADIAEPSSPLALEPNESRTDAKSPTKRSTQSPSPTKNKSFRKRLSDTIVKLLPASSPRAEPSPIKPASPPTPKRDSRERRGSIIIRSPNTTRSPLSSNSTPGLIQWPGRMSKESPFARWRPKRKSEPVTRLLPEFPSPSRNDFSPVSSIAPESPIRHLRPREPTPSKWYSFQPSTPSRKPTSKAAMHSYDGELELVKTLPSWMQHTESTSALENCDLSNIDFGPASPSFTSSVSWMNSPESASERERTRIIRRRKSEPLFRSLLKTQTSRRISLSPQKIEGASGVMPPSELFSHLEEIPQTSSLFNISESSNLLASSSASISASINSLASPSANVSELSNLPTALANVPDSLSINTIEQADENMDALNAQYKGRMKAIMRATGSTLDADDVFKPDNEQTAVERLAKMAETQCNGHAKVVVAKENGRLFVRFKLPFEYSHLFPECQGADENHISSSLSISKSPRVQAPPLSSPRPPMTEDEMWELEEELYLEECAAQDNTLAVSDFGSSPVKQQSTTSPAYDRLPTSSPAKQSNTSPAYDRLPTSSPSLAPQDSNDVSITFPDVSYELEGNTTIPGLTASSPVKTPIQSKFTINSDSSSLSDLESTPPMSKSAELSMAKLATTTTTNEKAQEEADLNLSFTPVNRKSAPKANVEKEAEKSQPAPSSVTNRADSPERDYMRDFIRRSKHRRSSTTTTALGSPIAQNQRQPLGARSPNMETQQPEKRKFESSEGDENEAAAEPAAKKIRRPRSTPPRPAAAAANADSGDEDPLSVDAAAPPAAPSPAPPASDSSSRRSSRLRTRSAIPKPSGPAPVRVGRPVGRPRTEKGNVVDIVHQTRANTRRNKGKAEYPSQVLARQAEAAGEAEEEVGAQGSDQPAAAAVPRTRRGKSVVWKEPLADFHEEEAKPQAAKPKRGRPAGAAGSKTTAARPSGANRVSKPTPKVSAVAARQRTSRIAAGLGMAGNGTPAPKRATRASTRSRK
ncbi:uncharacterized protein TrAFT101_010649 [Trichoderma asperellum]|uniref:Uncharacterized protein n=1 Tax=Trichoderma asperellum (strain ATCC 204424 / CBS 433.97 / NBRC 101777) TaxID=1042311 RepID=A0A2T3YT96_TRIA4|nr:hypothetical protein M441DRAFT_31682 [Trichoderma asperellum CBS 433.97]PTB35801.1 hypothetical protein M441DRAFT_31682 [Trichoderma asperellum CBS 433.97]UKZ95835.1 hypothetical protein TrAFT101_010649 [Trichoderma asperellum]